MNLLTGPLLGNGLPVPPKDRVGCDERTNFGESPSPDGSPANREPAALVVGQLEPSSTELLFEDSVLLSEVVDHRILLTGYLTGHSSDEDLPGMKNNGHQLIVATPRDNRQLSAGGETG